MSVPNEQTIANLGLLQSWTVTIPKKIVLQSVGFFYVNHVIFFMLIKERTMLKLSVDQLASSSIPN